MWQRIKEGKGKERGGERKMAEGEREGGGRRKQKKYSRKTFTGFFEGKLNRSLAV